MTDLHLDEEQVQRVLHGQLTPESEPLLRDHLGACVACRSRIEIADRDERRALALLRQLDHAAPHIGIETVLVARRLRSNGLRRWAAGVLLTLVVGSAVYAAPGSPIPGLIDRLIGTGRSVRRQPDRPATPNVARMEARAEAIQGVAADPGDAFTIEFSAREHEGGVAVSLTDDTEIVVRAVGGAATFTSHADRISVDSAASTTQFEIEVPRRAPRVEIRIGGRRALLKVAATITADAEHATNGRYLLRLSTGLPPGVP